MRKLVVLGVALLMLCTKSLPAQTIRGTITAPDEVTTLAGIIVVATNSDGSAAGRALSNARGTFVMHLASAGTVQLKLLRIGYRPTAGPFVELAAGATQNVRLVFASQAVALNAVGIRERETCRVRADSGLVVANVWEEARKAMLTSQISSEESPIVAEWVEYDRTLDSTARTIKRQRIKTARHATTHVFRSLAADSLANTGYVVQEKGGTMYYAPDAEVLLSDSFVNTHCFQLKRPGTIEEAEWIGVGFSPTRDRRDMQEIEGTIWIDRETAELKNLQFRYINLPDVTAKANPGGRVDFVRLADGNWLVGRWTVRMPLVAVKPISSELGRRTVMANSRLTLNAIQVTGGEVMRATRRDTLVYQGEGAAINVAVLAIDPLIPSAGAVVELEGTDYSGVADSSGHVHISPVLPGRYIARVRTALMDSVGVPEVGGEVEARYGTHVDSLALPNAEMLVERACTSDTLRRAAGMLHGIVKDDRALPVPYAAVTVAWQRSAFAQKTIGSLTDAAGYWQLCGIPKSVPLTVAVVNDEGWDQRELQLEQGPFAAVDLTLHPRAAANAETTAAATISTVARALIELSVADARGDPLANATLEVLPLGGQSRVLTTGPGGRALVPDIAPGVLSIRARRIGFMEGLVTVTVAGGRNTVPIIMSNVAQPSLDTIRVVGSRTVTGRHGEFESRRLNKQASRSITRDEIVFRNPTDIWQMLNGVPSIRIAEQDEKVVAISNRGLLSDFDGGACHIMIVVDGRPQNTAPGQASYDLKRLPKPSEIHGVEIFSSNTAIPLQYSSVGTTKWCGMLAFWTR